MMFIDDGKNSWDWHVGEPLPEPRGPVVKIQADGHELDFLWAMMKLGEPLAYGVAVKGDRLTMTRDSG